LKPIYSGLVLAGYASMKNGKIRTRWGGMVKKQKAQDWEQAAGWQLRHSTTPFAGPVLLRAAFYYDQKLADLDENLLMDVLQAPNPRYPNKVRVGVYVNDNQVKRKDTIWALDKKSPRVAFTIYSLEPSELDADAFLKLKLRGPMG